MKDEMGSDLKLHMKDRLYEIREMIDNHVEDIHASLVESAKKTLKFIQNMQKSDWNLRQRPISTNVARLDPSMFAVRRLWDQVAVENHVSDAIDFDDVFQYQSKHARPNVTKEHEQTTEAMNAKNNEKSNSRLTKGEEVEIMAGITKGDDKQIMVRTSKIRDEMVKLIMVNAKLDRFKRKMKSVNNKLVNRCPFFHAFLLIYSQHKFKIMFFDLGYGAIDCKCRYY